MADEKKNNHGEGCTCPVCGGSGVMMGKGCRCGWGRACGCGGRWVFFLLRTIITILILMVVFWFGVQVGRMTSSYSRGGLMMRGGYDTSYADGGYGQDGTYGRNGMMSGSNDTSTPADNGTGSY